ncbi:MAG: hypothetical protein HND27_11040 [Bacteroidetes bacterium]|nr:hypothetical protein [Bacteroidota bacterium]NOG96298.1 hypothetical protein [Bacteroidota bacterium]
MSKKNKNNNSSSQKPVQQNKDVFNVKENLKKLRSGTGKEGYETESDIHKSKTTDRYYGTSHREDVGGYSSTSTIDRFDKINDKFNSDFSVLKDSFSDHKEKVIEKLNDKVDKSDLKWWITGIIGGIVLIGSIIYTLSYQDIIGDVKDLKENKNNVDKTLINVDNRLNQIEKTVPNSTLPKAGADSVKKH